MLIDLHTHTYPRSLDSGLSLERLMAVARARGLDGICLTEHNSQWSAAELAPFLEGRELVVLRGMEVSTEVGHVPVFGLEGYDMRMGSIAQLHALVSQAGGAMILAHPLRPAAVPLRWEDLPGLFHAVEVLNGSDANAANAYLVSLAQQLGIAGVAGSDAHAPGVVGSVATRFSVPVRTEMELVREIRAGRCEPVHLPSLRSPPA
jgi:predicted metal-dependent phosphoesterase TrpH